MSSLCVLAYAAGAAWMFFCGTTMVLAAYLGTVEINGEPATVVPLLISAAFFVCMWLLWRAGDVLAAR